MPRRESGKSGDDFVARNIGGAARKLHAVLGDLPDSIVPLYEGIKDMYQPHLRYGIIALGDSTYANFCGGGLKFDQLLQEQGAKRIGEMLKIDASEDPEPESVSNPWVEQWATLLA